MPDSFTNNTLTAILYCVKAQENPFLQNAPLAGLSPGLSKFIIQIMLFLTHSKNPQMLPHT